ncbi:energy transducer TonB [Hyphococcus flavus]|uniref:Energy transducer TonB n=1 Tax=Hyphococcus flavus TaxID=1866326 RepID=A0AAF0CC01_9PROT|nr:energy transducer TonB [Hyphococcus flavus]WDI32245.1 energy transducer TonB [Hyphococcus flavus]
MGSFFRLFVGVPGAVVVTVGLFLLMAELIRNDLKLDEERDALNLSITSQIDDTDLNSANQEFKRPTLDAPPPPPPAVNDPSNRPALDGVRAEIPTIDANLNIGSGFNPDRDAQPLVRIPPQYPERCMGRASASESVSVQFDVTPDGQTTNIQVVDTSNSCLNRAATRSVERWKYQPKIVDNQAQWRRGVQTVITFELSE